MILPEQTVHGAFEVVDSIVRGNNNGTGHSACYSSPGRKILCA
jgi:hypothetical protein